MPGAPPGSAGAGAPAGGPGAVAAAAFVLGLRARGVRDPAVLGAMERVPREAFAPEPLRALARRDIALPLPCGQAMTAPSTIATMLHALDPRGARVLEVGTGSGYVSALLLRLGSSEVVSLERYAALAAAARGRLAALGFGAVAVRLADGCDPAPEAGTFARILVNGALAAFAPGLLERLAPGGRLVGALAGPGGPRLVVAAREADGLRWQGPDAVLRIGPLTPGRARVL
ncbi:Protein-L-isoaspartate O-methyltransferase [Methylobacterium crusticola]|uniref:Protein-L-isoaspartate O-methyltransferase n=1 Tax=Methylobacterium crusticola TaxID=1697972 RepID=A0ABQ4R648_9HYPH|nr:Protein-L-isoaspartate O-methyltransferase [Methylobacterium crusticola]